jgi:hypothetical protein
MTPTQLKTLINGDPAALAAFIEKDDSACAARCSAIALKVHKETTYVERTLYKALGPMVAEPLLQKVEAYAAGATIPFTQENALRFIVKRAIKWLQPSEGGWEFGSTNSLTMVGALLQAQVITQPEYDAIMNLSLVPQIITALDVEFVRTRI